MLARCVRSSPATFRLGPVCFLLLALVATARAENWPEWRGPHENGISSEKNTPVRWSKSENVAWRLPMPGPAGSTPVIWGNQIFLTSAKEQDLLLMCISTQGKLLWERTVGTGDEAVRGDEGNMASPSPATDGKFVWTLMGQGDLACFTTAGKPVWRFNVGQRWSPLKIAFGLTSTPVLDGDRLYVQLLHTDGAIVVALDKKTGRNIWVHQRKTDATAECLHSYASPMIYRDKERAYLLVHGSDYITAHDLKDGRELWRCGGLQSKVKYNPTLRFVASPAAVPGLIVVPSAKNGPVLGLAPDGKGDITNTTAEHRWTREKETPDVPSPLIVDDYVYLCRENGVLICMDAKTGEEKYMKRCFSDRYRASPVYADGKIYLASRKGVITVVKTGPEFEELAVNDMEEAISSSLALANGRLYIRTFDALYAVADKSVAVQRVYSEDIGEDELALADVATSAGDAWRPIFNGKDLSDWVVEGTKDYEADDKKLPIWTVQDGNIACAGVGYGFLRYDHELKDFAFRCEYQMAVAKKKCNSGIGIRGTKFTGRVETRPSFFGYEIQLLDDAGVKPDDHSTGSLYRYVAATANPVKPAPEWNRFEVECRGPRIKITINGQTIQDTDQSTVEAIRDKPLQGFLSLQNHGGKIVFRGVELREFLAK
ncbi:MAG: DUF1080 domain-containing protein [Planctomycetes bacterium]|nr:DUF1080 domain-containing protein [Planctomycetota bacterium]